MTITLLHGDCRDKLRDLADRSVQCIVTSPPYFGLRRYDVQGQQIGLEQSPAEYVAALVAVFRECRRVLRDDGVLWVNLGDSYVSNGGAGGTMAATGLQSPARAAMPRPEASDPATFGRWNRTWDLPEKSLLGIPWRVAFGLQDDGWILRSDIIWSKPNPMPESVTDRPTRAHEYLFLFAKQARYFYDSAAIAEQSVRPGDVQTFGGRKAVENEIPDDDPRSRGGSEQWGRTVMAGTTRNRRTVWTVATRPYSGAHFAVFPEQLIAPCILAGSASQACERCGAPWGRVVERESAPPDVFTKRNAPADDLIHHGSTVNGEMRGHGQKLQDWRDAHPPRTTGFRPTCRCDALGSARSIVLDPFVGSGTTCRVAERFGRDSIGIDLGYSDIQAERTDGIQKVMVDLL